MSWVQKAQTTVAVRGLQIVMPWLWVRSVRDGRSYIRQRGLNLAAEGAFRNHLASSTWDFALCGAPVWRWGGNDVDCRLCKALKPKDGPA